MLIAGAAVSFILLNLVTWLIQNAFGGQVHIWENEFQREVRTYHEEPLRSTMLFFTYLGGFYSTVCVSLGFALLLTVWREYREALMLLVTSLGAWLLNTILKAHFMRPRPELEFWTHASGYSFPSGHATIAAAMYGMLFFIWARYRRQKNQSMVPAILCGIILIALIGITRVYLGVHYPTDIIAGFASGFLWLITCAYALSVWQKRKPQQPFDDAKG
ncbi:phosphatase PAP2 family protein [Paenibacillus dauci]|uniref:phosphatase PAP2 family protein n=1 Tax=Paenibacillus dauci TaxID=1567106 RepID=UPI0006989277|nr:phosphatase PAP2 family protein [Paenibacillus dauci]